MTPIQTNKHVFFDDEGNILEGGSIWIGQPNTDPRTNPKTVTFTDAGGSTFTAQQPLKTKAGRIVYNGKPIEATVDGEHSMLVFDSSGKQTDYYRSIGVGSSGEAEDFSELLRVGLTLTEIKSFDVSVGDHVRNVGKVTATDNLGADWLAVSATGNPADDVDLIDFDNGLQGQRVKNFLYPDSIAPSIADKSFNPESPTLIWSGSSINLNVSELDTTTPGYYIVELDNEKQYSLISQYDLSTAAPGGAGHVVYGTGQSEVTGPTDSFTILQSQLSLFKSGSQRSLIVSIDTITINNSGTVATGYSNTQGTIAKVYKV